MAVLSEAVEKLKRKGIIEGKASTAAINSPVAQAPDPLSHAMWSRKYQPADLSEVNVCCCQQAALLEQVVAVINLSEGIITLLHTRQHLVVLSLAAQVCFAQPWCNKAAGLDGLVHSVPARLKSNMCDAWHFIDSWLFGCTTGTLPLSLHVSIWIRICTCLHIKIQEVSLTWQGFEYECRQCAVWMGVNSLSGRGQ